MRARMLFGFSALVLSASLSTAAQAWGERGHDGVSRIAVRILASSEDPEAAELGAFLQRKELMLGHLSNVPDIVWRSMGKEIDELSAPSHFVDMEFFLAPGLPPKAQDLPSDVRSLLAAMAKNCSRGKKLPCVPGDTDEARLQKSGHAPFRVETLSQDLVSAFKEIKSLEGKVPKDARDKDDPRTEIMNRALLHAGILSHFVGDLANPHHTSVDYDGWDAEQGGLHSYFESEIVEGYPLDFEATVLDEALRHKPMDERFARHPNNYLRQAWELALDSNSHLVELHTIDKKYSLLEKSVKGDRDTRKKAKRKDVKLVRDNYRNFVILRLAAGADALARIWLSTWKEAGKPDLSFYRSYHYDVKPDLIPLRYLPTSSK